MTLDWLIVGGGPHGVHTALRLIGEGGVPRSQIRILDDEPHLLARWRRATRNTGMRFLRSPSVHHLGLSSVSLNRFAGGPGRKVNRPFTRPYSRPALELFDLHCDALIDRYELQDLHVWGRVNRLDLVSPGARVGFEDLAAGGRTGEIAARRVVLAIGAPREPAWPEWARRAVAEATEPEACDRIGHVFDPGFVLEDDPDDSIVAVVGAGISGAQLALRLARPGRQVLLISRHALRVEQFDSDPGWQGPKHMAAFEKLDDRNDRRDRIRAARHRGSMPPDVHSALRRATGDGTIECIEGAEKLSASLPGQRVLLEVDGRKVEADRVLLATGFPGHRPGGPWLDETIEAFDLPCAGCGYPIVDRGLRWHPNLLVTGALAELELGPVSRNLSGAQRAGDRILAVARSRRARKAEGGDS